MRRPLDILKESWEVLKNRSGSVVPYILSAKEKREKLTELVQQNLSKVQRHQNEWNDKNSRSQEFKPRDLVLVLLPRILKFSICCSSKWHVRAAGSKLVRNFSY